MERIKNRIRLREYLHWRFKILRDNIDKEIEKLDDLTRKKLDRIFNYIKDEKLRIYLKEIVLESFRKHGKNYARLVIDDLYEKYLRKSKYFNLWLIAWKKALKFNRITFPALAVFPKVNKFLDRDFYLRISKRVVKNINIREGMLVHVNVGDTYFYGVLTKKNNEYRVYIKKQLLKLIKYQGSDIKHYLSNKIERIYLITIDNKVRFYDKIQVAKAKNDYQKILFIPSVIVKKFCIHENKLVYLKLTSPEKVKYKIVRRIEEKERRGGKAYYIRLTRIPAGFYQIDVYNIDALLKDIFSRQLNFMGKNIIIDKVNVYKPSRIGKFTYKVGTLHLCLGNLELYSNIIVNTKKELIEVTHNIDDKTELRISINYNSFSYKG
ncbi:MAG: hypothetical protein J7K23_04965, partial [Thermoproteales archaeon]|nr:hypothetical protein [Thermoproteales archaeon]